MKFAVFLPIFYHFWLLDVDYIPASTRLLMPVIEKQVEVEEKALELAEVKESDASETTTNHYENLSPTVDTTDLRVKSNLKAEDLDKYLADTGLAGLGQAYLNAEEEYGVNAIALCALTILESGWGTSSLTSSNNNISGTIWNGEYAVFDSLGDCITYTARNIGINYLQETGIYHNGYSIEDVNQKYCFKEDELTGELVVDTAWAENITQICNMILGEISTYEN